METDSLAVAVLEHLTGPSRGTVSWLGDADLFAVLDESRVLRLSNTPGEKSTDTLAHFRRINGRFEIIAAAGHNIWINGRKCKSAMLDNHDMIEFGDNGPISRFCICGGKHPIQGTFPGILKDGLAYFRNSRQPIAKRTANTVGLILRLFLVETTVMFRVLILFSILSLSVVAYQQWRISNILQERITTSDLLMQEFARTLARSQDEAVSPEDIETLRLELRHQLESAADRLAALEDQSRAAAEIIRNNIDSVFMLQTAYGYRHKESGKFLRQVLGEDGQPLKLPNGLFVLSLDGDGPIAERQSISTAFVVTGSGILVTNRHTAIPWETDNIVLPMLTKGLEPSLIKIVAYQPGTSDPITATVVHSSNTEDLALLQVTPGERKLRPLKLAEEVSLPGEEIVVIGYPTGLRSLLAQAGQEFISELQIAEDTGFWSVAERLAAAGKIIPLASMGIVGRVGEDVIVYDAETTHGGSGGPVFDMSGSVVAINTAILPEFGGSNMGIPASKIRRLVNQAGVEN